MISRHRFTASCLLSLVVYGGPPLALAGLLALLKVVGVLEWSWWVVTLPLSGPALLMGTFLLILVFVLGLAALIDHTGEPW